jgi:hypothetical protein
MHAPSFSEPQSVDLYAVPASSRSHFVLTAESEPSALPRILENFALRNLVPDHLEVHKDGETLLIRLHVAGLDARESAHLQLRMENILPVISVELAHYPGDGEIS